MQWSLQKYDEVHNEFSDTGTTVEGQYHDAIELAKPRAAELNLGSHWCLLQLA